MPSWATGALNSTPNANLKGTRAVRFTIATDRLASCRCAVDSCSIIKVDDALASCAAPNHAGDRVDARSITAIGCHGVDVVIAGQRWADPPRQTLSAPPGRKVA